MDLCKLPIVRPVLLDPTHRAESNNTESGSRNRNALSYELNNRLLTVKSNSDVNDN